jgi:hypothetical protein
MSRSKIEWVRLHGGYGCVWNCWVGCTEHGLECERGFSGEGAICQGESIGAMAATISRQGETT